PWEVNPNAVLNNPAEANAIVAARLGSVGTPMSRGGLASRAYAYNYPLTGTTPARLPAYSQVNWNGAGGGTIQLPGAGAGRDATAPTYAGGFDDNPPPPPPKATGHPALFNPAEWPSTAPSATVLSRTFSGSDLRRLSGRFAAELDFYKQADLGKI